MIGAPSLLVTLGLVGGAVIFGGGPPQDHSAYLSVKTYGPTGALQNGAHAVGNILSFMDMLASSILVVLAIFALVVTLFAVLLYLIGRGLRAAARWARLVGGLVAVLLLLNAAAALGALSTLGEIIDAVLMAGLAYALWVLIWRFAEPPPSPPVQA